MEKMDRIISRRPGAIVRFAVPALLVILAVVISSGFLFYFPETIVAKATKIESTPKAVYTDVQIKKRYLASFSTGDSIDVAVGAVLPPRRDIRRVKFNILTPAGVHDDFKVRLFWSQNDSIVSAHILNKPDQPTEIMLLPGKRSLKDIIF